MNMQIRKHSTGTYDICNMYTNMYMIYDNLYSCSAVQKLLRLVSLYNKVYHINFYFQDSYFVNSAALNPSNINQANYVYYQSLLTSNGRIVEVTSITDSNNTFPPISSVFLEKVVEVCKLIYVPYLH